MDDTSVRDGAKGTGGESEQLPVGSANVRETPPHARECGKPGPCEWCDSGYLELALLRIEGRMDAAGETIEEDAELVAAEVRRLREVNAGQALTVGTLKDELGRLRDLLEFRERECAIESEAKQKSWVAEARLEKATKLLRAKLARVEALPEKFEEFAQQCEHEQVKAGIRACSFTLKMALRDT